MAKKKYYAVKNGKTPGVYLTWDDCKAQVSGFSGAIYKSFPTMEEAKSFVAGATSNASNTKTLKPTSVEEEDTFDEKPAEGEAIAYVDGSYNVDTKEYACGMVFMYGEEELHIAKKGEDEDLALMRNVAGEILGSEIAMRKAIELGIDKIKIYHDYQGIASWCLGEWKTNKEGTKAYKAFYDSIQDKLQVQFVKVKGHSGDKYNDIADELAKSLIFDAE